MDLIPLVGVLVGLVAAWLLFVALLWVLRPRDARLGDLVRVVPDILRLCRDVLTDRRAPTGTARPRASRSCSRSWAKTMAPAIDRR